MKVSELINQLSKLDPDSEVLVENENDIGVVFSPINAVEEIEPHPETTWTDEDDHPIDEPTNKVCIWFSKVKFITYRFTD